MTLPRVPFWILLKRMGLVALLVAVGMIIEALWLAKPLPSLEAQAQCAAKVDAGGLWSGRVSFSHFNARLNRCFVLSVDSLATNDPHSKYQPAPSTFETREVFDAFEGRGLGIVRTYSDRPGDPIICSVELPGGQHKGCRSDLEWESLMNVYLER